MPALLSLPREFSDGLSSLVARSTSGKTDAAGVAILTSPTFKGSGTVTFQVSDLAKRGYTYNPLLNAVIQQSITVP